MAIKPFNVKDFGKTVLFDPNEMGYQDSVDIIHEELHKTRQSFIKIGWYLKHIYEKKMFTEDGYSNIYEFAKEKFDLSQSTVTRFMQLCCAYSVNHDSPQLDEKYKDFSISQLFEMLPMSQEQLEEVTPELTVRQIRDIKESGKSKERKIRKAEEAEEAEEKDVPGQTSIEENFPEYMPDMVSSDSDDLQEKGYATSHEDRAESEPDEEENKSAEDSVVDGVYKEIEPFPQKDTQPELPVLKNPEQRKEWLKNYKDWGLWYRDDNIDVNYYKFDFKDGSRLIVAEYPQRYCYWTKKRQDEYFFHLLEKKKKAHEGIYDESFRNQTDSETYLVEFLKNMQKRGNGFEISDAL